MTWTSGAISVGILRENQSDWGFQVRKTGPFCGGARKDLAMHTYEDTKRVTRTQRFRRDHPCPICGGYDLAGKGYRCWGFLSGDGRYAHCTRQEYAGYLFRGKDGAYAHYLTGYCRCGESHGESPLPPVKCHVPERTDKIKDRLDRIFAGSHAVSTGDPVDLYLRGRNIRLNSYPRDLRTHMSLEYWQHGSPQCRNLPRR